jgi:hypothetical protein
LHGRGKTAVSGSKKGERRGNARKRPAKPPNWDKTHETPNEIMREAVSNPRPNVQMTVERRIQISRMILGSSGAAEDVTPKEAMLQAMHHNLQACYDWIDLLGELAKLPPTPENTLAVERCEREIERLYDKVADLGFKVGGFVHPKLLATHSTVNTGANQASILQELMEEIDQLERDAPIPIEHKPSKTGGG